MPRYIGMLCFIWGLIYWPTIQAQESTDVSDDHSRTNHEMANHNTDFVVRFGMGGFRDGRSPENKLGGGQLALDVKPWAMPLAISFTTEYYTNSANPTHFYEIESLYAINAFYVGQIHNARKFNYFIGGGIGRLEVPKAESDPEQTRTGNLVDLETGINYLVYKKFGIYGVARYLRAEKTRNSIKVIDFDEWIGLLGVSYSFSL